MENIKIIFISLGVVIKDILSWIFSDASSGFLTLITGLIAIWVYFHQLKTKRKEIAIVLLSTIKSAEEAISSIKKSTDIFDQSTTILSDNIWTTSHHLFSRKLNQHELDLVTKFFSNCEAAQSSLSHWRLFLSDIAMRNKAIFIQEKFVEFADKYKEESNALELFNKAKQGFLEIIEKEQYWFLPNKTKEDFLKYLSSIESLTGTTAFEKIRHIAEINLRY